MNKVIQAVNSTAAAEPTTHSVPVRRFVRVVGRRRDTQLNVSQTGRFCMRRSLRRALLFSYQPTIRAVPKVGVTNGAINVGPSSAVRCYHGHGAMS